MAKPINPSRPPRNSVDLPGPEWLAAAAPLPGKSLQVAVLLRSLAVSQQASQVELSNVTALHFGVKRNAKYRALEHLERKQLISVVRRRGRSPLVTLRDVKHQP
jgi:hypothetical protein